MEHSSSSSSLPTENSSSSSPSEQAQQAQQQEHAQEPDPAQDPNRRPLYAGLALLGIRGELAALLQSEWDAEYASLHGTLAAPTVREQHFYGEAPYAALNRFLDVLPSEEGRVLLGGDAYINADLVPAERPHERPVILTQAPFVRSAVDTRPTFLQMLWERRVPLVLCMHDYTGREAESDYLPASEEPGAARLYACGDLGCLFELRRSGPVERYGAASNEGPLGTLHRCDLVRKSLTENYLAEPEESPLDSRPVLFVRVECWPDHGIPEQPRELLALLRRCHSEIATCSELWQPVAIHCRAGVGRSGTVCGIWRLLDTARCLESRGEAMQKVAGAAGTSDSPNSRAGKFPPVKALVLHIRRYRRSAVQTKAQYALIQLCLELLIENVKISQSVEIV